MATITIIDESTQGEQRAWSLDFLDETITLRELIRRRIYQEVTEYNAKLSGCFRGLVQPTEAERAFHGDGYHLKPLHKLDWQAQYERALEAFTRRGYIILSKCSTPFTGSRHKIIHQTSRYLRQNAGFNHHWDFF